jgi:DNA-binding MarR family transcriptional regulator
MRTANVREAKRLFERHAEISVVVMEIEDGDGGRLAEALRTEHPERGWVEFVILSTSGTPDAASGARDIEVLRKPLLPGQLLAVVTEGYNAARLRRLQHEEQRALDAPIAEFQMRIGAAASQLLARIKHGHGAVAVPPGHEAENARRLQAFAHDELVRARIREKVFGPLAHNHTGWMLLLVLSEARQTGQEVTIKGAAYHAGLPLSSALRKLNDMCAEGLAVRRDDPRDARRSYVALTPLGQSYLDRYEAEMRKATDADRMAK